MALGFVKERVKKKIEGWKASCLSLAGKEVLIKAVAMAVPAYPMHCFKFPAGLCQEINGDLVRFWWANQENDHKIHWRSWEKLGMRKENGGLGFRDLLDFNLALLGKQCWRLINNPDSLWARILKARYFPNGDSWNAEVGHRTSWAWASLIEGRDTVLRHARKQIFNGAETNIWVDRWLKLPHNDVIVPTRPLSANTPIFVEEIMNKRERSWDLSRVSLFLDQETIRCIISRPIGISSLPDRWIWPWTSNGEYSVKSGYHITHSMANSRIVGPPQTSHVMST
ncbi:uncharacterized protein LOC110754404 [Prunus avium]|uniref:Uncharacterized protein LOC110754404 n=1 Tax=Prunus avium TaxID=42229 RepID=A0A6P5SC75_PRUAV|nr:uncharacterized protein LOC110754404 [Prunus avium]